MFGKQKFRQLAPYMCLPVPITAMLFVRAEDAEPFMLLIYSMLLMFGYIAAVVDIKTMRIPNKLLLAQLVAWLVVLVPKMLLDTERAIRLFSDSVLGFFVGGTLFILVYLVSKKGLGGGDVKFMAVSGLYLGFGGVIPAMLYGTFLAAVTGIVLILLKRIGRKEPIPLAPFLYAGILITTVFS